MHSDDLYSNFLLLYEVLELSVYCVIVQGVKVDVCVGF